MVIGRLVLQIAILLLVTFAAPPPVAADEDLKTKMDIINDTADRICGTVSTTGSATKAAGSGEVKAEVNKLVKTIANVGAEVKGGYERNDYEGVLQRDLTKVLKNTANCKKDVLTLLVGTLIEAPKAASSKPPGRPDLRSQAQSLVARWCSAWLRGDASTVVNLASEPFWFDRRLQLTKDDLRRAYERLYEQKGDQWRGAEPSKIEVHTIAEWQSGPDHVDLRRHPAVKDIPLEEDDYGVRVNLRPGGGGADRERMRPTRRDDSGPDGGDTRTRADGREVRRRDPSDQREARNAGRPDDREGDRPSGPRGRPRAPLSEAEEMMLVVRRTADDHLELAGLFD